MKLSKSQVENVAKLARLELTEAEIDQYTKELSAIMDYVESLNKLDVQGVEPTYHVVPLRNVLREDETRPSFKTEELLSLVPSHDTRSIKVPKIIEAE